MFSLHRIFTSLPGLRTLHVRVAIEANKLAPIFVAQRHANHSSKTCRCPAGARFLWRGPTQKKKKTWNTERCFWIWKRLETPVWWKQDVLCCFGNLIIFASFTSTLPCLNPVWRPDLFGCGSPAPSKGETHIRLMLVDSGSFTVKKGYKHMSIWTYKHVYLYITMLIVIGSKVLEVNRGGNPVGLRVSRWEWRRKRVLINHVQKTFHMRSTPDFFLCKQKTKHIVVKQRQIHNRP